MANIYNISIDKNSTYNLPIILSSSSGPYDLSGYTCKAQIRRAYESTSIITSFYISGTLDTSGTFTASLGAKQTEMLPNEHCVYDILLIQGDYQRRILQGTISPSPEVSR